MDENPDFFKDYLIRKASRHMIDSWLVAHSLPPGHCLPISPKSGSSTPHTRCEPWILTSIFVFTDTVLIKRIFEEKEHKWKDAEHNSVKVFQVTVNGLQVNRIRGSHTYQKNQCPGKNIQKILFSRKEHWHICTFRSLKKAVWPSPGWPQWTGPRPFWPAPATTTRPSWLGRSGRSPGQIFRV